MSAETSRRRWWPLRARDPYAGARCVLCGRPRAPGFRLVQGQEGYLCDDCVVQSLGVLAAEAPRSVASAALTFILAGVPETAPQAVVAPLLTALVAVVETGEQRAVALDHAIGREHLPLARRALASIPPGERTAATWQNFAALCLNHERFDEARAALDAAAGLPDGADLFAECHRAMIAARTGAPLEAAAVADLVARVRGASNPWLLAEALEVLGRHRSALGDHAGALAAVDEALAGTKNPGLLVARGDLLATTDPEAARAAWREALALASPDGPLALRARDRLGEAAPDGADQTPSPA